MKHLCHNLTETNQVAQEFLSSLKPKSQNLKAIIVGLKGDLGSGKTAFTQLVAKNLGVKEALTSPTFVLMKSYKIATEATERFNLSVKNLIHIDAYRLKSGQDLLRLGWAEISADPKNLILVEWPEIIADIWQPDFQMINFEFIDEQTRKIAVN